MKDIIKESLGCADNYDGGLILFKQVKLLIQKLRELDKRFDQISIELTGAEISDFEQTGKSFIESVRNGDPAETVKATISRLLRVIGQLIPDNGAIELP